MQLVGFFFFPFFIHFCLFIFCNFVIHSTWHSEGCGEQDVSRNLLCKSEDIHASYTRVHWCKKPVFFFFFFLSFLYIFKGKI